MAPQDNEETLGFEAELVFADNKDIPLGVENDSRVNRPLATQETIGRTSYSAYVRHVQYGTYENRLACLVGIDVNFRFPSKALSRFTSAEVEITFEKALDITKPSLHSTDATLDPTVANFAPKQILGQVKERENKKAFEIEVPVVFNAPFGSAEVSAKWSHETTMTEEGRLEVHGNLAQDDDHDEGANSVTWDLTENPISKGGILRSFRAVVVLFLLRKEAIWVDVSVKPVVQFSLDPRRLLSKQLVRKGDEPVLLDGYKQCGDLSCLKVNEFDSKDFPWEAVLNLPTPLGGRLDGVAPNDSLR